MVGLCHADVEQIMPRQYSKHLNLIAPAAPVTNHCQLSSAQLQVSFPSERNNCAPVYPSTPRGAEVPNVQVCCIKSAPYLHTDIPILERVEIVHIHMLTSMALGVSLNICALSSGSH